jgi:hypothetical protein
VPLVAAAVVVGVVVLIIVLVTNGGGGSSKHVAGAGTGSLGSSSGEQASTTHTTSSTAHQPSASTAGAASPAEINVAVLNGTEKTGLAHHVAGELTQFGYSKAAALGGRPAGANPTTVVEYTSGHQADASAVAHALGVATVQPIEVTAATLAGSASVVVVVGLDKAASVP